MERVQDDVEIEQTGEHSDAFAVCIIESCVKCVMYSQSYTI